MLAYIDNILAGWRHECKPQEIRFLGEVQTLTVSPGNVLVVTVEGRLAPEAVRRIRDELDRRLPGQTVILLQDGMKLEVLDLAPTPDSLKRQAA